MKRLSNVVVMRPPSIMIAIGWTISRPATLPMITKGRASSAKGLARVCPEPLAVIDKHDAVAGSDAQNREERDHRAERERGAVDECRQRSAGEGHRQGEEDQTRQAPAPERGLKEQEAGDHGDDAKAHNRGQVDLLVRGLLAHLGVVLEWEPYVREASFDVAGHRAEAATAEVGFDVHVPFDGVTLDDNRRRSGSHVGDLSQLYVAAVRRVDQQIAD